MNRLHQTSESNTKTPLEPTEDQLAFIARMREAFQATATNSHRLAELYESGDADALNTAVENLAYDIAENDVDYIFALDRLKKLRSSGRFGESEKEQIAKIQTIIDNYKELIVFEAGLPDEARFGEIEKAKQEITSLLDNASLKKQLLPLTPLKSWELSIARMTTLNMSFLLNLFRIV